MRFYTTQPQAYGGIDLHARSMVPLYPEPGWRDHAAPEQASRSLERDATRPSRGVTGIGGKPSRRALA